VYFSDIWERKKYMKDEKKGGKWKKKKEGMKKWQRNAFEEDEYQECLI